jgi:FMN-dependent dehydrogenase
LDGGPLLHSRRLHCAEERHLWSAALVRRCAEGARRSWHGCSGHRFRLSGARLWALLIAPSGLNGLLWPHGDLILAGVAAEAGIPFVLSTASTSSIKQVTDGSQGDHWFRLYIVQRKLARHMIERAVALGYSKLVLTTDVGVNGNRERGLRNGFGLPMHYTPKLVLEGSTHLCWSLDFLRHGLPQLANFSSADSSDVETQGAVMSRQMDASFNWADLAWLRKLWPRELLIKRITSAEDAAHCVAEGADGVVLSNHGVRQLDGCLSPLQVLAEARARIAQPILDRLPFDRRAFTRSFLGRRRPTLNGSPYFLLLDRYEGPKSRFRIMEHHRPRNGAAKTKRTGPMAGDARHLPSGETAGTIPVLRSPCHLPQRAMFQKARPDARMSLT